MTYDNAPPIHELAVRFRFDREEVAMKNSHHAVMDKWCQFILVAAKPATKNE
jgi:hypothetical protein